MWTTSYSTNVIPEWVTNSTTEENIEFVTE